MGQAKNNILFKRKPIVYLLSLICDEMSFISGIKYDCIFIFINICKMPREVLKDSIARILQNHCKNEENVGGLYLITC